MDRASASGSVDLGFHSESDQTIDLKLVFTASMLDVQHRRDRVEQAGKLACCTLGKALNGITHLSVADRWSATPKRARTALGGFFVTGG